MSPSEQSAKLSALALELSVQIERTIQAGELSQVRSEDLTRLMSGAVKLYAAQADEAEPGAEVARVIDDTVSTTDALVVACALLRAHHLNPFDLALWFQRSRPSSGGGR
jgi:adenine/guanine phosphoribosyltransferase-like PRPP-binding protein